VHFTTSPATVQVKLYDEQSQLIDQATKTVTVSNVPNDVLVIDNSDPRFSTVGAWSLGSAQANRYGTNYAYATAENPGTKSATWNLTIPTPGPYNLYIWYPEASNRSTNSPFVVHASDGDHAIAVNQQVNGGRWISLGTYIFAGDGSDKVSLSNNVQPAGLPSNTLVLADAVRIEPVTSRVREWQTY
jgi:hypothetical protein